MLLAVHRHPQHQVPTLVCDPLLVLQPLQDSISLDPNKLLSLPDHDGLYRELSRHVDLSGVTINPPLVRNCNGSLIIPRDYKRYLTNGAVVAVEVLVKL